VKPTDRQQAALVLAESEGYIRPASPTHARRCATTVGHLTNTAKQCQRNGWLCPISGGRYTLTEAGHGLVPSRPRPRSDGETWAQF
jgi:hypothetical protein